MPLRNSLSDYRYAFQGQEKDTETGKEAFELRLWDARIGRWLTTDPYRQFYSPYMAMGNNPTRFVDPDGGYCTDGLGNNIPCPDGYGAFNGPTADTATFLQNNVGQYEYAGIQLDEVFLNPETILSFDGARSPGRNRVDGTLRILREYRPGVFEELDSFPAVSGSRTLLPIPNGNDFILSNFDVRDERGNRENDRMMVEGHGFSVDIGPDGRHGRSLLRIHPDGGLRGTQGCIGLTCGYDRLVTLENSIRALFSTHTTIRLQVSGSYNGPDGGWPAQNTTNFRP